MDCTSVIFCSKVPWNWMAVYKFSRISIQWQCFRLHLCLELVPLSSNRSSRRKSTTDSGRRCSISKRKRLCKHTLAETTKAQKSHKGHVVLGIRMLFMNKVWFNDHSVRNKSNSLTMCFLESRCPGSTGFKACSKEMKYYSSVKLLYPCRQSVIISNINLSRILFGPFLVSHL